MPLTSTNAPVYLSALALVAILAGLAGRKSATVQVVLCALAPVASAVPFVYFLTQATVRVCVAEALAQCAQVPYTSTWEPLDWLVMTGAMVASLAPILAFLVRNRLPSIVAATGLLALVAVYPVFLWSWTLTVAVLFAAAIAGPPPVSRLDIGSERKADDRKQNAGQPERF